MYRFLSYGKGQDVSKPEPKCSVTGKSLSKSLIDMINLNFGENEVTYVMNSGFFKNKNYVLFYFFIQDASVKGIIKEKKILIDLDAFSLT